LAQLLLLNISGKNNQNDIIMSSIVGEKYRSADGWTVTDKIFGYLDKAGSIYNKIRYPQPGDPDYVEAEYKLRMQQMGMFGLPKPWGFIMLSAGIGLLAWGIYKIAK
jgi:hypothetical protein